VESIKMNPLSTLISGLLALLAWLPLQLVRALRRLQMRGTTVVRMDLFPTRGESSSLSRHKRLMMLASIEQDPQVRALVVRMAATPAGWAEMQEMREAFERLRQVNKRVLVFMEQASNAELYLSSAADRVWMPPVGALFLTGLGGRLSFFGRVLTRFGVRVELMAAGNYKSFGEPFTRRFASPNNREQLEFLYGDLQDQLIAGIAEGRGLDVSTVREMMASSPMGAEEAAAAKLIDGLIYADELSDSIKALLDVSSIRTVSFGGYRRLRRAERWLAQIGRHSQGVVVVHLEGPVVMGGDNVQARRIEARTVVPVLHQLADDERIRAVVLRVDSGGGSALASDLIARAVQQLKAEKPVIAAYGNIVASGGYYLSVHANEIIARRGTITGSIGVVGGKVVVSEALARQGLTGDFVDVGPDVGFLGPFRSFNYDPSARFWACLLYTSDAAHQIECVILSPCFV